MTSAASGLHLCRGIVLDPRGLCCGFLIRNAHYHHYYDYEHTFSYLTRMIITIRIVLAILAIRIVMGFVVIATKIIVTIATTINDLFLFATKC